MEEYGALLWIWFVYAGIASVLSAPIVFFGRKRVHWHLWELLALIIPYLIWLALVFSALKSKSLANLGEPIYISFAVPILALLRVGVGGSIGERVSAASLLAFLCLVAVGVYFAVPCLPE